MSEDRPNPDGILRDTRVGAYTVAEHLGSGGFGSVYRVVRAGKPYVVKVGRQRLGSLSPEERAAVEERLAREVASLVSLRHPNIVPVYGFDRWPDLDDFPYIATGYVDGSPLKHWFRSVAPSLARVVGVFEKIANAVAHVHSAGICHRDLKSDNVLVARDGEPVLIDFGIARPRVAFVVTRYGSVGTITHYPPEYAAYCSSSAHAQGEVFEWKPAADMHALGFMLYEVLSGSSPFPAPTTPEEQSDEYILHQIEYHRPVPPSARNQRVPAALDEIALRLLAKAPSQRPSASELEALLRSAREVAAAAHDPAWEGKFEITVVEEGPRSSAGEGSPAHRSAPRPAGWTEAPAGEGAPVPVVHRAAALPKAPRIPQPSPLASFQDVGASEPRGQNAPARVDDLAAAVQEAKRTLQEGAPRKRPGPVLVGAGVLALALLAIVATGGRGPSPGEGPRTLVGSPETKGAAAPPTTAPGAPSLLLDAVPPAGSGGRDGATPGAASPPEGARPPGEVRSAAATPRSSVPRARSPDRPPSPVPPLVSSTAGGAAPAGMVRSRPLVAPGPAPQEPAQPARPRGVPFGAHIRARLLTNLDTRTIGAGPVEAVVVAPLVQRGEVVLAARTLAYGVASETSGRFTVRFTRLRLPDDTEVPFEGVAFDLEENKPGLAAARRVGTEPEHRPGLATQVAKGTGNILLDTITGGTSQDVARSAGQTVLNQQESSQGGGQAILLLDAGVVFDIFVERSF